MTNSHLHAASGRTQRGFICVSSSDDAQAVLPRLPEFGQREEMAERTMMGRRCAILRAYLFTLAVASFLAAAPPARALRFELQSGNTKCVSEDIKLHAMSVGKYAVVNPSDSGPLPDSHKITVRVTSPYGNSIHYADLVDSGNFAFTSNEEGDYLACLWAPDQKPPATMVVEFEWRTGVTAKDWPNVAKKGQIDVMELELKKLEDTIKSIHDEMFYLREREEQMQDMNRSTNSRMAWLSFLSLAVCLSVAGLQLWHLKTFFERKKLL
ncbi:hypothetical protein OPV22_009088 [Ensete ventricosum]|uniref:GOLD domain-containing protein n=1 Tax=Ensete ventricosum TaxID=4639 RepID=A0AAV8RHN7_ENSVE|nr:hypothetical protein OPV22_009088 [Ensete ventricosum]